MAFTIGEYQDVFLEEADEQLQELNQNLLQLEKEHGDIESINNIFRAAHSLKSSAAFVGLNELSDLAHNMENLLQGLRDRTMDVTSEIINVLFQCFDVINSIIESVSVGEEPDHDLSGIMKKISQISRGAMGRKPAAEQKEIIKSGSGDAEKLETGEKGKSGFTQDEKKVITEGLKSGKLCCEMDIFIEREAQMRWVKVQLVMNNLEQSNDILKTIPSIDEINNKWDDESFKVILLTDQSPEDLKRACQIDLVNRVDIRDISLIKKNNKLALKFSEKETIILEMSGDESGTIEMTDISDRDDELPDDDRHEINEDFSRRDDKKSAVLKSVKVSVDKLDLLLNNVGELVIANSGFFRLFEEIRMADIEKTVVNEFKNRMDQMSRIAKDLQSGIMKTRMVPIGQVFSRFNRLVRDLAKEFGKKVRLELKGEDTELDKKVIDAIGEPLIHLIRNSIDHGIESVDERKKAGKTEEAVVSLNAYQGGNQIIVQVSDDGRGLNVDKIKKIALEKGYATADMIANMDNYDIYNFIFASGFSTADVITDISGRGVGMSVVKEIVNELSGSIRIDTEPGMGTKFELTFPLTLAIIPAIMVKVSHEMYAIPLADVIETVKISFNDITTIESREVVNLRGEILSLLRLNEFVGIESSLREGKDKIPVVVVGYGNRKIGIVVDQLEGKLEIVIKSLDENYTNIEGLSGASILGDGNICLILDIASMINKVITDEERYSKKRKSERLAVVPQSRQDQGLLEKTEAAEGIKTDFTSINDKNAVRPAAAAAGIRAAEIPAEIKIKNDRIDAAAASKEKDVRPPASELKADKKPDVKMDIREDIIFKKYAPAETGTAGKQAEVTTKGIDDKDLPGAEIKTAEDDEIAKRIRDTLSDFRKELEENIKSVDDGTDYLMNILQIKDGDMDRVSMIMNVGIANAAEALSRIIDKEISISIPDVKVVSIKSIPETLGDVDTVYIGVHMPIIGDIKGSLLFSLSEDSGYKLIDMLYGTSAKKTKSLNEDGESALVEVTNIVGSSVLNTIADKIDLSVRPDVPTIIHDYIQSTIDSIMVMNNIKDEYALYMDTLFFYQDNSILGKMLILSETESLKRMIEKLRDVQR